MEQLNPSDLKTILHSKRANLYYLEHARVMQKDGRVLYLTEAKNENPYWNIPIANTTVILLGTGTSITQAAMRMLASAGGGFTDCGGTPLFMGSEIEWMMPQSEYRPMEYMQGWMSFWLDEAKRFEVAKQFQFARIEFIRKVWAKDRDLQAEGFYLDDRDITQMLTGFEKKIPHQSKVGDLLLAEAQMTKQLYKIAATRCKLNFERNPEQGDLANDFLNHGNYLAYGFTAM
ncbi:CRISPR-associated endonuclease cas1 [Acinetobacter sp. NIPH 284]|nr:CRISPR-associated endonuclease cas1 [Acinetobacter sp. NIPH 284]